MHLSIYDRLPIDLLTGFYYEISHNIERGLLSDFMLIELDLIHTAAKRRGILLSRHFTYIEF